ncbi:hypothetical protein ABT391_13460 [Streptomyces jumonjinensis]|uniref:hypothetical protein n=1 Tax=Streptomyces jumonjinensis TaxID=1945 RepID=UPI00129631EB
MSAARAVTGPTTTASGPTTTASGPTTTASVPRRPDATEAAPPNAGGEAPEETQ